MYFEELEKSYREELDAKIERERIHAEAVAAAEAELMSARRGQAEALNTGDDKKYVSYSGKIAVAEAKFKRVSAEEVKIMPDAKVRAMAAELTAAYNHEMSDIAEDLFSMFDRIREDMDKLDEIAERYTAVGIILDEIGEKPLKLYGDYVLLRGMRTNYDKFIDWYVDRSGAYTGGNHSMRGYAYRLDLENRHQ